MPLVLFVGTVGGIGVICRYSGCHCLLGLCVCVCVCLYVSECVCVSG